MRDITLEDTFYHDFTTRAFATGVPTVLAGTPVLSVLEENNATPITAGVSVSVDRASVVGLNMATVVATAANGYEAGKGYSIYISTGTVGGVSVVGEVVGQFTIGASAAAVDLANGTDGLGAIKTDTAAILVDTGTTLDAALAVVDANVDQIETAVITNAAGADVAADIIAMKVDTAAILVDTGTTLDAALAVVDANVDQIETAVITNATGVDIAADIIAMKAETVLIVADTNELQVDNVPGLISTLDAVVDTVKAETALIVADTNELQTDWVDAGRLDTLIDQLITESSAQVMDTDTLTLPGQVALSVTPTPLQALAALYKNLRNRKTQTATTWSLYADDTTTQDQQAAVSDDGTTAVKGEIAAGT